ncbi:MAG: two-component system OmpR family sensor histidine kinase BaeS [Anaerolineaceae bacterium]|nr:MAG: two-component system OmpR family sensor histidine kinase BaeS [Anaerolineaceae bacterium]
MRTISRKLTLAFLLVAVIAAALVAVVVRLTSPDRLNALLRDQARAQLETVLVDYYTANGSFDGVATVLASSGFLPPSPHQVQPGQPAGGVQPFDASQASPRESRLVFALADERGVVILTMLPNYALGSQLPPDRLALGKVIEVDGRVIGTIFTPPDAFVFTSEEQAYLDRTSQALWLAALGAIAAALVTGVLLARSFARPVRLLTSAARKMAGGELEQEVPVASKDEIGELTQAFNSMSHAVSQANQLRKQMTADIAHDLRTPLTVIAGYIESMQEGVLEPTPERLEIIHSEIERLQRMVEDLRTLSRADAGELALVRQPIAPRTLLERVASVYCHAAGQQEITLKIDAADGLHEIHVDEARMVQVLGNLVDNALRYTPAGGTVILGASQTEAGVTLLVQDAGQGIQPEDLPHVFERFYRADKSRADAEGASGLGLAIARAIVVAHGGELRAESAPGEGTLMVITLPIS